MFWTDFALSLTATVKSMGASSGCRSLRLWAVLVSKRQVSYTCGLLCQISCWFLMAIVVLAGAF